MIGRRTFLTGSLGLLAASIRPSLSLAQTAATEFELTAGPVRKSLYNNELSDLWVYNGTVPGPELRVIKGEQISVAFRNNLAEPTSIHWHGIRIDNAMDGVSSLTQDPVLPGETFEYRFNPPDAGTFWYHAHTSSMEQVARGLYGPLIIDEPPGLQTRYKDIVLMLDDWWLDEKGRFKDGFKDYLVGKQGGRIGNVITVNGGPPGTTLSVTAGEIYRLRLINAANARVFTLKLNASNSRLIAIDGINLEDPENASKPFSLAPAQRADFLVAAVAGQPIKLCDADETLQILTDNPGEGTLIRLVPEGASSIDASLPEVSRPDLPMPDISSAHHVKLIMEGGSLSALDSATYKGEKLNQLQLAKEQQVWTFNGTANLPDAPLFSIDKGTSVIVEIENRTGWKHAMHIHGHHFKYGRNVSSIGSAPWHDTVFMDRWEKGVIGFVADNPGKWLLHCHMLQHATAGMNTWFEIG